MGRGAIKYFNKCQPFVVLSSTKSKYRKMADGVKEIMWVIDFLKKLGMLH
jgi:hypothetical protein